MARERRTAWIGMLAIVPWIGMTAGCNSARPIRPEMAQQQVRPAAQEFVEEPKLKRNAELVTNLGHMRSCVKEYDKAIPLFQEALEKDSKYIPAYIGMCQTYVAMNEPAKAVQTAQAGLVKSPTSHELWNELAAAQAKNDQLDAAITSMQKAVELSPGNRVYLSSLAGMLSVAGRVEESYQVYQRIVAPAEARYRIAGALFHTGHKDAAAEQLRLALRLQPNYAPAAIMLAELANPDYGIRQTSY